ncbi:hypothetical protein [Calothrix sp. NIES-2098]|uniref:hypothetical protein n=1 Tax=Calothrix sp. NIES-2098 TaxID=1954171 RepID=UPI0030DD6BCF
MKRRNKRHAPINAIAVSNNYYPARGLRDVSNPAKINQTMLPKVTTLATLTSDNPSQLTLITRPI